MAVKRVALMVVLAGLSGCASLPGFPALVDQGGGNASESKAEKGGELFDLARDIEANGGGETAFAVYREAVDQSGGAPSAYVRLGEAYLRADRLGQAAAAYRAALAKDANNAEAQLGLGTALARQGALTKALPSLAKAAPLVNTGTAYNRLGVTQTMAGHFSDAQKSLEKALTLQPDDLDIATNLALAEALAGESDSAVTLAREIAQSPTVKTVHRRNLVIVLGILGKTAEEAKAVAPADLSQPDFDALFRRAASIRRIADPKARARALGTMQS